jgi:Family of unknown function (DUF5706)
MDSNEQRTCLPLKLALEHMKSQPRLDLEVAERQLDRTHAYFPRIDGKVSALFAILTGQVAIAAVNVAYADLKLWWFTIPAGLFVLAVCISVYHLYQCLFPHLTGGQNSLVFFSEIAKIREADFVERYGALSEEELLKDVISQVWRNSQIVSVKFRSVNIATQAIMIGSAPWSLLLLASSISNSKIPTV